jgi:RHS repeat-associated protein
VSVARQQYLGVDISGNSIFENAELGIDLYNDGVTPNDTGDPDTGPNNLQNFPVITAASSDGSTSTTIDGTLNSTPSTTFRLEFFASLSCDPSGNGEGEIYIGTSDEITDINGDVTFSVELPVGIPDGYTITATATDPDGNTSEFSACLAVTVEGGAPVDNNWYYNYDPLYRLTYACSDWDDIGEVCNGDEFEYAYDAVGNRTSQTINSLTNTYTYDIANRLIDVGGQTYTWDNNGNLLSDGVSTYTYDKANRLSSVTQGSDTYSFVYNGLGDRLQQTVNTLTTTYTLDLNTGLTQVLSDGTSTYLYGNGRISEYAGADWSYYLSDALGSVRQMADSVGGVTLTNSYEPYGSLSSSAGTTTTNYGFAGEWTDGTGLQHLRARYLDTGIGRFISRDVWAGDYNRPLSLNKRMYVEGNPVNYTDPSGQCTFVGADTVICLIGLTLILIITVDFAYIAVENAPGAGHAMYDLSCNMIDALTKPATKVKTPEDLAHLLDLPPMYQRIQEEAPKPEPEQKSKIQPIKIKDLEYHDDSSPVYRRGNRTAKNLTPRFSDTDGLSFTMIPPVKGLVFPTGKKGLRGLGFILRSEPRPDDLTHFVINPGPSHLASGWSLYNWAKTRATIDNNDPLTWHPLTTSLYWMTERYP